MSGSSERADVQRMERIRLSHDGLCAMPESCDLCFLAAALREAEAVVEAAREYVGVEPLELWARHEAGDEFIGITADPDWKRLVKALYDHTALRASTGRTE